MQTELPLSLREVVKRLLMGMNRRLGSTIQCSPKLR